MNRFPLHMASFLALGCGALGCGSGDDGAGSGDAPAADLAHPPGPGAAHSGDGGGAVLAVSRIWLGDTDRTGARDSGAWRAFGYDIDGLETMASSTDVCQPVGDGPDASIAADGDRGRDNAFGQRIVPILQNVVESPSDAVSGAISDGTFTVLLRIDALGAGPGYYPLQTRLYGGDRLDGGPAFDGSDAWPVMPELLEDGDIERPRIAFAESYVTADTWVSGPPAPVDIVLVLAGYRVELHLEAAVISVDLASDRRSGRGTLAGVVGAEELVSEVRRLVSGISADFCDLDALDPLLDQIREAADILEDGTQDASATCDGISVGLDFDVEEVLLGGVGEVAAPYGNECAG